MTLLSYLRFMQLI